jgi:hypothetical protein
VFGILELLLFVVFSAAAVAASRHAWCMRQAYGWYRFFAFEALGLLIAWNVRHWFREPFSIQQVLSWTLFAVSATLAVHGIFLLSLLLSYRVRVTAE